MRCARPVPALVALLLSTALASCGSAPATAPEEAPDVSLHFQVSTGTLDLQELVVTVSGPDIPVPLVLNLVVSSGVAEGSIDVPAGRERVFTAQAFDPDGFITHEGSTTVTVRPDASTVRIPLLPFGVGTTIEVVAGAFTIAIAPGDSIVALEGTLQLTASVSTPDGEPVADAAVVWGSTRPDIAAVDPHGVVSGRREGTADIVASFAGTAAVATVRVAGGGDGGEEVEAVTIGFDDTDPGILENGYAGFQWLNVEATASDLGGLGNANVSGAQVATSTAASAEMARSDPFDFLSAWFTGVSNYALSPAVQSYLDLPLDDLVELSIGARGALSDAGMEIARDIFERTVDELQSLLEAKVYSEVEVWAADVGLVLGAPLMMDAEGAEWQVRDAVLELTVRGSLDGAELFVRSFDVSTAEPVFVALEFEGIDHVSFDVAGAPWERFAMDDGHVLVR